MNDLALSEAYEKWADDLVRFATALIGPHEAADVVADSFVALLEDGGAWDRAERPRSFLFGVVANRAKMRVRTSARRRGREQRSASDLRIDSAAADAPADARALLGAVSIQQRMFLYLAYWEDWPVDEIAAHADVSEGTVRKQLARARLKLREELT